MRSSPAALLLVLAQLPLGVCAQEPAGEYDIKAALLYNFARFIEWPDEDGSEFRVCIAGRDPFGSALDALTTRAVRERPMRISRPPTLFRDCQLVFVPAGTPLPVPGPGTLVVAEDAAALAQGAAIVLYLDEERVGFDINPEAAARAKLKISYKLLRLARPRRS